MQDFKLEYCPIRIPSKGKKIFILDGVKIFIRPVKGLVFFYETSTGVQLLCVDSSKKNKALELIHNRIQELKDFISNTNS